MEYHIFDFKLECCYDCQLKALDHCRQSVEWTLKVKLSNERKVYHIVRDDDVAQ